MNRDERLRRIVKGKRREAALKAWDTRRSRKERSPASVDADSRSVARVLHGDEETADESQNSFRHHKGTP